MYEKELTITSSTALLNSQQQQQRSRMESLEKTVEGYRELVERLEADLENAVKGLGNHIHHYNFIHSPPPHPQSLLKTFLHQSCEHYSLLGNSTL
jgi:hypothetical protein